VQHVQHIQHITTHTTRKTHVLFRPRSLIFEQEFKEQNNMSSKDKDKDNNSSSSSDSHDHLFKFIIIGDTGAGKSCLLRYFLEKKL